MEAFDLFFENHPTPMWVYDLETLAFLIVNNAAVFKYGYTKDEFLQMTLRDIRPAAEIPRLLADIEQERPSWQQSGLWPHQLRDGSLIQVEITSHTIVYNGRSAVLVMAQDRTEQINLQNKFIRRQAQLRTTLYSIGDAVIATDVNGRVTLMNPVAEQLTGWPENEAQGRLLLDIFPIINENSRQPVENPVSQVLQTGATVSLANHTLLIHRDGSERPIADAAAPIWGENNQLTGIVLIFRDRTEERQAQTAVRQAKERLEQAEERLLYQASLIENVSDAIISTDLDFTIRSWNQAATAMYGWSAAEAMGQPLAQLIQTYYWNGQEQEQTRQQLIEQGVWRGRVLQRGKDGTERHILSAVSLIYNRQGEPAGAVAVNRDITEQVQHEQEAEKTAVQMTQIMGSVPDGIVLLDADHRLQQVNPRAIAYLSQLTSVTIGQHLTHLGEHKLSDILTVWSEEQRCLITITAQTDNGHTKPTTFEVVGLPIENDTAIIGWVIVIRDVTDELAIQQQLQRQERLAAVGQLAAGIAHDFNNIMGVIILYTQFLVRSSTIAEEDREQLVTIENQANQASALIEQLLDFSRQAMLARQPLDLRQLLSQEIELLRRTLPEHIEIELVSEEAEYIVQADPTRLQQSFMNLALNARDAMPKGGQLRFALSQQVINKGERPFPDIEPGYWLCLQVSDTGKGIEPTVLDHIFEPFFTTKKSGTGTGLGLAQVYGIVRQHGGHVMAESRPGQGSTFTIYLPALTVTAVHQETSETKVVPVGSGQLLLVVEDQAALRAALADSLQAWGYQTLEAAHGEEALTLLHERNKDVALVLSDVIMPRMGGVALAQAIREQKWQIPVVLLTGHPLDETEMLGTVDIWALLTKPVDSSRLAQTIAAALA